jgi:hypothetical protein
MVRLRLHGASILIVGIAAWYSTAATQPLTQVQLYALDLDFRVLERKLESYQKAGSREAEYGSRIAINDDGSALRPTSRFVNSS